ncbi:MAG: dipeptidase [Ignavibacteria bacterium]|nr:dipeptidase [Ignavibacteria bacterium]
MKAAAACTVVLASCLVLSCAQEPQPRDVLVKAREIAHQTIIVDTHIDLPYRLTHRMEDISVRTTGGDFDYPRAVEGGLNVPFMSIYIPAGYEGRGARKFADTLIAMVEDFVVDWPDKFSIARSVSDVHAQVAEGKISMALGMENGAPIEGKLENVRYFYDRGIRYITLTHSKDNHICDSSYDTTRTWNGLSPFGRKVVGEMNRLGIMVDVSHITDSAFYQVMAMTKAPVIASHSSCRFFTPSFERNMDDGMIRLLASKGGVIQINFGSTFINDTIRNAYASGSKGLDEHLKSLHLERDDEAARPIVREYFREHGIRYATVAEVVAHIDHVVELVGVDHVGFGSDFDGVGYTLPVGLEDVSCYPNIIAELLRKGYSEEDIGKICSGNILRVWSEVEQTAHRLQQSP